MNQIEEYIQLLNDKEKELAYLTTLICHYQEEIAEKDQIINNLINENKFLLAQVIW